MPMIPPQAAFPCLVRVLGWLCFEHCDVTCRKKKKKTFMEDTTYNMPYGETNAFGSAQGQS